jgi:hypothetical protein
VTVPAGTALDVVALSAPQTNRPANLGTVRILVGAKGSTSADDTVTVTFRKGARPAATLSPQLKAQGAEVSAH